VAAVDIVLDLLHIEQRQELGEGGVSHESF
jgi:hypothetical protein